MCGIAGVLFADRERPVDREVLDAMGAAIVHRGPDADGRWLEPGVGLVHRRLSIIDPIGGNQPLGNEDGSIQVVFNGEIYNFLALRSWLESKGHRFSTRSDTEVIVHLYEEEGEDLVKRLRGMFAFALWDRRNRRLMLARDRVGIKPLYLYRDNEKIIFGSEIQALFAYPGIARRVDVAALDEYLAFGMVGGSQSIFVDICKLPPAHVLVVSHDSLTAAPRRYWHLSLEPDLRPTAHEWRETIRAKIEETVRVHLISDVPVGVFLSGGVDSSMIVACSAAVTRNVQTFSIGFHEESFSELVYARQVAERFRTTHVEEIATPDAVSLLDELTESYGEPFGDSSAVPTYLLSRLASRSVKVVLSGDGGDEAFGGYPRYVHDMREAAVRRWLPVGFRRAALEPAARLWPKTDWLPRPLRAKTVLTNLALDGAAAYANTLTLCRTPLRRALIAADLRSHLNGNECGRLLRESYASAPKGDTLGAMIAADVATMLPDGYLVKVDRVSMAHSLEVRTPFLDHELLELAASVPSSFKVRRLEAKWLFKTVCSQYLPTSIVWRPKHGFEIPLDDWLRYPLREVFDEYVLQPGSAVAGLIDQRTARRLHRAHLAGTSRNGTVLWSLLMLARWANRYLSTSS
jgi:asparagine synthase (glutamine-hydrolysing)